MWPRARLLLGPDENWTPLQRRGRRPNTAAHSEVPGFFVLDFDHNEAMGRHGGTGFGAVAEFVQAIDVRGHELAAPDVEQRADHLAHHVAKKGAPAHRKDQLLV